MQLAITARSLTFWFVVVSQRVREYDHEPNLDPSLVPKVEFRHLVKRYGRRKDADPALNDLNLTLYQDQITSLIGHNGRYNRAPIAIFSGGFFSHLI